MAKQRNKRGSSSNTKKHSPPMAKKTVQQTLPRSYVQTAMQTDTNSPSLDKSNNTDPTDAKQPGIITQTSPPQQTTASSNNEVEVHLTQTGDSGKEGMDIEDPEVTDPMQKDSLSFGGGEDLEGETEEEANDTIMREEEPQPGPKRRYQIRVDWKIKVELQATFAKAFDELHSRIEDVFAEICEHDSKAVIYPYFVDKFNDPSFPPLKSVKAIPSKPGEFKQYFDRAFPKTTKSDGNFVHTSVYLGLSKPLEEIRDNMTFFFKDHEHGIYVRQLQTEKTVAMGWLLWSIESTDKEALKNELSAMAGNIPIGLRWKTISLGIPGTIPKEKQVKALHLEIDNKYVREDGPIIKALLAADSSERPLGSKFRLVPEMISLISDSAREKAALLRERQKAWNNNVVVTQNWEIAALERPIRGMQGRSLRDLIMSMTVDEDNPTPLFSAINKHWSRNGSYLFAYSPRVASEAQARIAGLLAYLHFEVGEQVHPALDKHFTVNAVEQANQMTWNNLTKEVETADDLAVGDLEAACHEEDMEFIFDIELTKEQKAAAANKGTEDDEDDENSDDSDDSGNSQSTPKRNNIGGNNPADHDSVSTFRTKKKQKVGTPSKKMTSKVTASSPARRIHKQRATDSSVSSDLSSVVSRLSSMEEQLLLVKDMTDQFHKLEELFLKSIEAIKSQSPGTAIDSSISAPPIQSEPTNNQESRPPSNWTKRFNGTQVTTQGQEESTSTSSTGAGMG